MQGTEAGRFQVLDNDLEIAPVLVEADLATDAHLVAFLRHLPDALIKAPEHGTPYLGPLVLEGEVPVTGGRTGQAGQFAFHPGLHEAALQQVPGLTVQFGNGQ